MSWKAATPSNTDVLRSNEVHLGDNHVVLQSATSNVVMAVSEGSPAAEDTCATVGVVTQMSGGPL